ncbi:Uncharacterized protein BP5553_09014 [Venustampulla echinocandica]|uniref:HNH domain-containing protein n=1 Tax=Venustampulla echinocandica TaxID=2656787 RepID=A0A370TDL0_9HELO|nr:Uncharacterized protein BP5553_09014 [Venustampulla echinocandica]RDL32558.1 Uncharacterized protein BP5553_09014 [Venustampulla echinocandica]
MDESIEEANFQLFRDCLSTPLIDKSSTSPPKKKKKIRRARGTGSRKATVQIPQNVEEDLDRQNDAEDLAEFIDYLASEIFTSLPQDLRTLTYSIYFNNASLQAKYSLPLSTQAFAQLLHTTAPSATDTLIAYYSTSPDDDLSSLLSHTLTAYLTHHTTPPPPPSQTRDLAQACELCERSWIPLTYHHLIPRAVHAKVQKRGWHTEDRLNSVAWLCRACHSFIHRVASNEELAKEWYTVERLRARDDVGGFVGWVGGVRWKAR